MDLNAQVDQRRQDKESNAPALGQDPQTVRRTSGLTVEDVLAVLNGVRDAALRDFCDAKACRDVPWMSSITNELGGIDKCRAAVSRIKNSQSS